MFRRAHAARPPATRPSPDRSSFQEAAPSAAQFAAAGRDGRLDPVRWRRPGRAGLLRLAAVAALIGAALAVTYARDPVSCPAPASLAGPPVPPASPAAGRAPSRSGDAAPPAPADGAPSRPIDGEPVPPGSAGGRIRAIPRGSVGVPVRLAEPAALAVLRPGDRVDLLLAAHDGDPATVAANALVLGVGPADDPSAGLFLALTEQEARRAAATPGNARFSVLVRPPP